jgi:hypothetical protein
MGSLRLNRPELRRLSLALALSLTVHLLGWGGYAAGKEFGWWQQWHRPAWLPRIPLLNIKSLPPPDQDQQLVFVEVPRPSAEAPDQTKYYSSQNSRAADPTPGNKDVPQLNGKQTEIVKTETVLRPDFNKSPPAPPEPPEPPPAAARPGDLTLGKPDPSSSSEKPRPRTVKEARAQQPSRLPGPQMKQPGGMRRQALVPSLDVKATAFGAYDAALIEAVTQRWYDLLDSQQFSMDRTGKVILKFHLNYDGTITDMNVVQNTVGDLLGYVCQKAISDPAPFARWPGEMRREIGKNYREITFTFYYY